MMNNLIGGGWYLMIRKTVVVVALMVGIIGWVALPTAAQPACNVSPAASNTSDDVSNYITDCLSVSDQAKTSLSSATTAAINGGRLSAEETLNMLQRLEGSSADQDQKEEILTTFTNTLNAGVPAQLLIDEITQAIALNVSPANIVTNVEAVAATLTEVNTLLVGKGLRQQHASALVDAVVSVMAEALEDYIANSSNPSSDANDAAKVSSFVMGRLNALSGSSLNSDVVDAVQANVQDGELSTIAVNVCTRRGKC